jgi:hypothetical protein
MNIIDKENVKQPAGQTELIIPLERLSVIPRGEFR